MVGESHKRKRLQLTCRLRADVDGSLGPGDDRWRAIVRLLVGLEWRRMAASDSRNDKRWCLKVGVELGVDEPDWERVEDVR